MEDTTVDSTEAPAQKTLDEIKAIVHELEGWDDPTTPSDEDNESYRVAVLLLAALNRGVDLVDLTEFTGYHAEWVAWVAKNLADAEIWVDGMTHCNWFDEDAGSTEFWIDAGVGCGLFEKAPAES